MSCVRISPLSASLIFLDLALVIGPIRTYNGSFNACRLGLLKSFKVFCGILFILIVSGGGKGVIFVILLILVVFLLL